MGKIRKAVAGLLSGGASAPVFIALGLDEPVAGALAALITASLVYLVPNQAADARR